MLGLYYGDKSIAETKTKIGRTPPLHLTYYDFSHNWAGAETNGDWSPWGGAQNGKSATKYIADYRYVQDKLAQANNLIWVWCPNVTDEPNQSWNQAMNYYPGDAYSIS